MMTRVSWLAACLMVLAVSQTAHAVTLSEFLTDDTYRLFREKALATTACLTDPAVSDNSFNLDECPSLIAALDVLNTGVTDVMIDCEPSCSATFAKLSTDCLNQLTDAFEQDTAPFGAIGSAFLAECASGGTSSAPAPAPADAPSTGMRRFGRRL